MNKGRKRDMMFIRSRCSTEGRDGKRRGRSKDNVGDTKRIIKICNSNSVKKKLLTIIMI